MVLFADTFNDHFHPDVAIAAVEVLEDAGFFVHVPMADVCCGRPLYDYGFLGMAKRWWVQMLDVLRPYYVAGMPMVVLEPSCWASFKDELGNLMPNSEDAKRLADLTFTLADFLEKKAPDYRLPRSNATRWFMATVIKKRWTRSTTRSLENSSLKKKSSTKWACHTNIPMPDAVVWPARSGTRKINDHYEVGVAAGERCSCPKSATRPDDELIIADGFSCQEQIIQQTDRTPLHTAQVLQMALHGDVPRDHPEASIIDARKKAIHVGMAPSRRYARRSRGGRSVRDAR